MKILQRVTAIALAITLSFTVLCSSSFAADTQATIDNGDYLKGIADLITQKYNGNLPEQDIINSTVKSMFNNLDEYSTFYTQKEFNSVFSTLEGAIEGVGIQVNMSDKYVTVLRVFSGAPAQKAGVLSGDKIAEVNGENMAGKSLEDVVAKVKGPAGTKVKLGILRQGSKKVITLEMSRAQVTVPSVSYEIRSNIGYILIEQFTGNTGTVVSQALKYFDSKKITRVVLDLRNNPGGLVDQAVQVAGQFVPKGLITTLDFKDTAEQDIPYYSSLVATKYKLAVLVNENSASASEILTGAIKDTKAGVIIGTKTFGKAKVQSFIPILSSDAYIRLNKDREVKTVNALAFSDAVENDLLGWSKMTIGMYYTPNGECIDLKGIEPNIKVSETSPSGIQVNLLEPMTTTVKPSLGTQYMDVYSAECVLKLLKYNVDTPDFIMDKKTFAAIKKFQKDSKVYSYGVLDFCTQKLLNKKLATLKQTKDAVYAKAVESLK